MADFTKFIQAITSEARPDVDNRTISPQYDLLIRPHAKILEPFQGDVDELKTFQSIQTTSMPEAEYDKLLANVFGERQIGSKAVGTARVSFSSPTNVRFTLTDVFTATNGQTYNPVQETFVAASQMALQQDGGLFYADVAVICTLEGESGRIAAGQLTGFAGGASGFVRVNNPFGFSGGADRETNEQVLARIKDNVSVRDLVTGRGIRSTLQTEFPQIKRIKVIGYLDEGQNRDVVNGLHIGGQADIFVKADTLLSETVTVQAPLPNTNSVLDGAFPLFTSGSAAALRRPAVQITSVRLLDALGVPTTQALQRFETALVPPKALETQRLFSAPSISVDRSLNTVHVAVAEQADSKNSFINYGKYSSLGVQLMSFARVSSAARSPSKPHIVASGGQAFIFWSAQGEIHATVLNIAGPTFTVVRAPFVLMSGVDELDTMDTAFDADGTLHIAIARIQAVGDDASLLIGGKVKRNLWYAKLLSSGSVPVGFVPLMVGTGTLGSLVSPKIVVQGAGVSVRATIVCSLDTGSASNIVAVQLDNTGTPVTGVGAIPISNDVRTNEFPVIGVDAEGKVDVVWVQDRAAFQYARFDALNGFQVTLPQVQLFTRSAAITDVAGKLNLSDFFQLAWVESVGNQTDIVTGKVHKLGRAVGTVANVSSTLSFSFSPDLDIDLDQNIHVVWSEGSSLASQPYYTKRKPQEFSVVTEKPNYRYSSSEEIAISAEVAAPNGVAVDVAWSPLVAGVQSFVSSDDNRVVIAGLLVRHFVPAEVTLSLKYTGPASLLATQVQVQVTTLLNALQTNIVDPSVIIATVINMGATSVDPIDIQATVDQPSGVIEAFSVKGEALVLPANASVIVKAVNVTKKA